jgi:hypothetical protein
MRATILQFYEQFRRSLGFPNTVMYFFFIYTSAVFEISAIPVKKKAVAS